MSRETVTVRPLGATQTETFEIASEQEVIDFANKVREAGGAEVISELMPSFRSIPNACLIANSLNFACRVFPLAGETDPWVWVMGGIGEELTRELHEKLSLPLLEIDRLYNKKAFIEGEPVRYVVQLPEHIGNVARAFDNRVGWPAKYDKK